MAAPFPSTKMEAWPQRRGQQTMNLRSVFTAEQQRILERYYDNGMTNQSKACFQLILHCAQEAKLDFSVVRTWVGNKRRKLASKIDQNGSISHSLPGHGISGGLHPSLAGTTLSNHSLAAGVLLSTDMTAARNIQNRVHLLPQSSSFPSLSSTSSSPSSSSPLSSGSNNNTSNNDVILTGIYSLNSVPRSQPRSTAPSEPSASSPLISQVLQSRNTSTSSSIHSKLVSLAQTLPSLTSASGPLVYTAVRKGTLSVAEGVISAGAGVVPHSWTRQYGTGQTRPWSASSQAQTQALPRPHSNPQLPAPQKPWVSPPNQNPSPLNEQTPRIQQVFTLSEKGVEEHLRHGETSARKSQETHRPTVRPLDTSHNLSIAMETGDEEDEWQREEELANMAAQTHIHRERAVISPAKAEGSVVRGGRTPPPDVSKLAAVESSTTIQGSYSFTVQTSVTGESSSQPSLDVSAAPWVISNSRKRTLQDRTQFSDADLVQLKRYWDRGMTNLGSMCREKIAAAANQLNIDAEIVKEDKKCILKKAQLKQTWISNRRRKYRLMGIEIPPAKGRPIMFTSSPSGNKSDGERPATPDLGEDLNDEGSPCLPEDGTLDSREINDGMDISCVAPLTNNVKIENIDEDEEADDDDEIVASDLEQMQNLLEFKHEEVQFLEHELENQKQRYQELVNFTKGLLVAVRTKDLKRQQELLASLPQPSDQDWDVTLEQGVQQDATSNHHDLQADGPRSADRAKDRVDEGLLQVAVKQDDAMTEEAEPSASEDQLQETVTQIK
ncbi:Highly divergent homeobox [Oryzias melastigma]|uniref:Highly divergent homeobox n=1 Tax=Oryzias melastigma TaxID=30732 RepID=A0A834BVY5_ORYME|nr:Highly divergent homeobox [Oryzias melastigma]